MPKSHRGYLSLEYHLLFVEKNHLSGCKLQAIAQIVQSIITVVWLLELKQAPYSDLLEKVLLTVCLILSSVDNSDSFTAVISKSEIYNEVLKSVFLFWVVQYLQTLRHPGEFSISKRHHQHWDAQHLHSVLALS